MRVDCNWNFQSSLFVFPVRAYYSISSETGSTHVDVVDPTSLPPPTALTLVDTAIRVVEHLLHGQEVSTLTKSWSFFFCARRNVRDRDWVTWFDSVGFCLSVEKATEEKKSTIWLVVKLICCDIKYRNENLNFIESSKIYGWKSHNDPYNSWKWAKCKENLHQRDADDRESWKEKCLMWLIESHRTSITNCDSLREGRSIGTKDQKRGGGQ